MFLPCFREVSKTRGDMGRKVNVLMSAFSVEKGDVQLYTHNLGSCIAVCLWDRKRTIGGLAHISHPEHARMDHHKLGRGAFAAEAIGTMLQQMYYLGSEEGDIVAKLVGAAHMLSHLAVPAMKQSVEAMIAEVENVLIAHRVFIISRNLGGESGRNMFFNLIDGAVVIDNNNGESITI